jgi:hypothetical protein
VEAYFRKLVLLFSLCYAVVLVALASAYMLKILSPRGLGIAGLISMVTAVIVLTHLIRKAQKQLPATTISNEVDGTERKRIRSRIRFLKIWICILAIGLIYGLSQLRGQPLWLLLVLVAMNQLLMWSSIHRIRGLEARLK